MNAIGYGNSMFLSTHGILARPTSGVSDPDAQAFITAAVITDSTQQNAINQFVIDLKAYGIWNKMKALYPFVGGTASTHKFNLKNPLDTNAAFRILWNGGVTHSSNGVQFGGVNGYGDTNLLASTTLSLNSTHVSVYSRTNANVLAPSICNIIGALSFETSLWLRDSNTTYLRVNTNTVSTQSSTDSTGLFIGNRVLSTQQQLMVRGTLSSFSVNSNTLNSTRNYFIGGDNISGTPYYDSKQIAFASIGDGLTSQNMTDLTTAVQAFQTTLGRQV